MEGETHFHMAINQGFKDLKDGSLYVTLSIVVLLVALPLAFLRSFLLSFLLLGLELVSYALFVFGISKIRVGLFRTSERGGRLGNLGTNVFVLGALALIFSDIYLPLAYIGAILVVVGNAVLGYAIYQLGKEYGDERLKLSGVMIMGLISAVFGYPFCYLATSKLSTKSFEESQRKSIEVSDKSVGYGWLRSNGEAEVTIYSQTEAEIVDASLLGFPLLQVSPRKLIPGENKVSLKFQISSPLTIGNVYVIELKLSDGTVKKASVIYEV